MADDTTAAWVAGVDGCKAGWIVVSKLIGDSAPPQVLIFAEFAEILQYVPQFHIVAVDMPIGLPDHIGREGRGAEQAVRKHLGERQSSVFAVPSRAAVYEQDYLEACRVAQETSCPPKKVSKQCYHLFPKIREIDGLMTPKLEDRIYEVHPELAFWRLNGMKHMSLPKKVKSRANDPGLNERRDVLVACGMDQAFLDQRPPRGAGRDDLLDAAANCLIAERILQGKAEPFPQAYACDGKGLRMAIWA
ncbi:DUF429 domain-containing protein [Roseibium sp.]|uniref:DUF429 domain-containing protein n=1 Tax=Roseibium sp. TaxID=1936156 RepID=UPI003A970684